jgi:branched-chain amino acid transport system substrate-binding protein
MNNQRRRALGLVATATSLVLFASACGGVDRSASSGGGGGSAKCDPDESTQGVTDDAIKLGITSGLSGPSASAAQPALDAQRWVFDQVNDDGGIEGRKIELVELDDKYDPEAALQNVRRLNDQEKVFAISGGVGTQNFVGALPYINQAKIPAIGPYAPSNQIGTMDNPYVYMLWTNFADEFNALTSYIVEKEGAKSISLMAMTGDVGDDAIAGMEAALDRAGMEATETVRTEPNSTDFRPVAEQLKKAGSEWVLFLATPPDVGNAITALGRIGYEPKLGAQSDMLDSGWIAAFGKVAQGLLAPSKLANLATSEDPQVQDFVSSWKDDHDGDMPTSWNAVGYVQATVTVEALKEAEALTRSCLEASLQAMDGFETGVIPPVTFGPDIRQGVRAAGIEQVKGDGTVTLQPFSEIAD